jgi:hypothetical protein
LAHCAGYAHAWARLIIGQDVKSGEDRDIPEGRGLKMKVMRIPPPVFFHTSDVVANHFVITTSDANPIFCMNSARQRAGSEYRVAEDDQEASAAPPP